MSELPYYDEKGIEIKEFAVIKVYHFKGVNEQGRGRKIYYMYKWIRLKESKGSLYWAAYHLNDDLKGYYWLKAVANEERKIIGTQVIQSY